MPLQDTWRGLKKRKSDHHGLSAMCAGFQFATNNIEEGIGAAKMAQEAGVLFTLFLDIPLRLIGALSQLWVYTAC